MPRTKVFNVTMPSVWSHLLKSSHGAHSSTSPSNCTPPNTISMASTDDDDDIKWRIQDLPQELADIILGHTLPPPTGVVTISRIYKPYRPPPQLSIDFYTRQRATESYYSKSVFVIANESLEFPTHPSAIETTCLWLSSLSETHIGLLSHVRCYFKQRSTDGLYRSNGRAENKAARIETLEDARDWLKGVKGDWKGLDGPGLGDHVFLAHCKCQTVEGVWEDVLMYDTDDADDEIQATRDTWVPGEGRRDD